MATYFRKRSTFHLPITLSVSLMVLNVALMVCWIIILAKSARWTALTVGIVAFTLILVGLSFWLVLSIKEIRLNHRQANFVDSVTHELKSPIAALQLYLETLRMRTLDDVKREEFHAIMARELHRLDELINQLLEVGRLDAIGESEALENVSLLPLLEKCGSAACVHHGCSLDATYVFDVPQLAVPARRIVLDLIFANLLDNAVKYAGEPPQVTVSAALHGSDRVRVRITNNGVRIPYDERKKIFQIFYRGGSELERRRKGTGLGLYIVQTLVRKLNGRISVRDRDDGEPGTMFEVELPGKCLPAADETTTDPSSEPSGASAEAVA